MKLFNLISLTLLSFALYSCQQGKAQGYERGESLNYSLVVDNTELCKEDSKERTKIQVGILLDTSSSMDGLIEQAKSQLWNIINTLTTLKFKGKNPIIEIALYEYGNDWLSSRDGYIRQVTPLTTDLDLISEKLFTLRTNGGSEFCGAVIQDAIKKLKWEDNKSDMKLIYIAGNEPFNQGNVNYKEAISDALTQNIYVNTIYCGDYNGGIKGLWKDGAEKGKGKYFNIDSNAKIQFISTPFDDKISKCNERLNFTYISYGSMGYAKQVNQEAQDNNAMQISSANYAERVVSKSKSAYTNASWDLVDKVKEDDKFLATIDKNELPKELQGKSTQEIKEIVDKKLQERNDVQKEIASLAKQRQDYIDSQSKQNNVQDDLGKAINSSILAFAKEKGFEVE